MQESEVESADFVDVAKVKEMLDVEKVCPDSAMALKQYFAEVGT